MPVPHPITGRCRRSALAVLALCLAALEAAAPVSPAAAQGLFFGDQPQQRRVRRERIARKDRVRREVEPRAPKREKSDRIAAVRRPANAAPEQAPDPLLLVLSLPGQRMQVYDKSGVVAQTKVSTGQAGHRTPAGIYSVLQRNRYHHSNIYSGAPMPFMQRITWSGIALHQGVVPGYPASHGCIRLPADFAPKLWGMGRVGMRVVVSPSDTAPVEIAHAHLPAPVLTAVPASALPTPVQTAAAESTTDAATADAQTTRLIDPFRLAYVRRNQTTELAAEAEKAVRPATELAQQKSEEANRAKTALRAAETAARKSPGDEAAQKALEDAKATEAAASDAAFAAAAKAREVSAAAARLHDEVKRLPATLEPVSIFVSKKEGRVFVRQGFVPIHDEPIQISEPDRPLGTHVFTALEAKDSGATLRWVGVTMPAAAPSHQEEEKPRRRRGREVKAEPKPLLPPSDAKHALDRFELPPATQKLVAERLWPGSSLIVSDLGASLETGKGTDFVIQTR